MRDRSTWLMPLGVLALLAYHVTAAWRFLHGPGLSPDECLFVDAALGGDHDVYARLFGAPVLVMPYIGALKSYLYVPLFRLAAPSVLTIRLPMIALTSTTLLLYFELSRRMHGRWLALLTLGLLATDPVLSLATTVDFGPVALMLWFKALALLLALHLALKPTLATLLLLLATLALGTFDKLSFLWLVIALGVSLLVWHREPLAVLWRHDQKWVAVLLAMASLAAVITLWYGAGATGKVAEVRGADASLATKLSWTWLTLRATLNGSAFYEIIMGAAPRLSTLGLLSLVLATMAAWAAWRNRHRDPRSRFVLVLACLMPLMFAEIVVTRRAGGPHHLMMLWPLSHLLATAGAAACSRADSARKLAAFSAVVLITMAGSQVLATEVQLGAMDARAPFDPRFDPAIEELANLVDEQAASVDTVVLFEWGIGPQLRSLCSARVRAKLDEQWYPLFRIARGAEPEREPFYRAHLAGKQVLAVFAAAGQAIALDNRATLMSMLHQHDRTFIWRKVIADRRGNPLYAIALIP